ncbi:peptidase inhibitor family I36 protein [Vibrio coralliilyticus]|uniref:peptidase inhibitor family I36 protein n=1 Tax=Vibrio coralliilyticus TaxID=190893 RepID=UPI002FD47D76
MESRNTPNNLHYRNQISSFKVEKLTPQACFYTDSNYFGSSKCYQVGQEIDLSIVDSHLNNKFSSVVVSQGAQVKFYKDTGFSGSNFIARRNYTGLGSYNDAISSFKVEGTYAPIDPIAVGIPNEDSCHTGIGASGACSGSSGFTSRDRLQNDSLNDSGAAHLYWRNRFGENKILIKPPYDQDSWDNFGTAVILSGNNRVLVVGAPGEDNCYRMTDNDIVPANSATVALHGNCNTGNKFNNNQYENSGTVYVYTGHGDWDNAQYIRSGEQDENPALKFHQVLKAPVATPYSRFGSEVHISADGERIVVGAPGESNCGGGVGGTANNPESRLGGNPACTGTYGELNYEARNSGAAYVYKRNSNGWYELEAYIKAPDPFEDDMFGSALGLSSDGQQLLVGAPGENSCGAGENGASRNLSTGIDGSYRCSASEVGVLNHAAINSGAVYQYRLVNGQWTHYRTLKSPSPDPEDNFGTSLSFTNDNNYIAISAPGEDGCGASVGGSTSNPNTAVSCSINSSSATPWTNNELQDSGAVYYFHALAQSERSDNGYLVSYVKASNPDAGDSFGSSIWGTGADLLMVGAPGEDNCGTGVNGTGVNPEFTLGGNPACGIGSILPGATNNNATDSGAVYLYSTPPSSVVFKSYIKGPQVRAADAYGTTVMAVNSSTSAGVNSIMAAASPGFDGSLRYDLGRVFLHEFSPTSETTEYEDSYDGLIERDIFDRFSRTEPRELTDGRSEFDYFGGSSLGGGSSEAVETTSSCDLFGSTSGSALGRVADFLTCLGQLGVN